MRRILCTLKILFIDWWHDEGEIVSDVLSALVWILGVTLLPAVILGIVTTPWAHTWVFQAEDGSYAEFFGRGVLCLFLIGTPSLLVMLGYLTIRDSIRAWREAWRKSEE